MTTDEKLDAFIAATNARLDRMEKTLNEVVESLTITPEVRAEFDKVMDNLRQTAEGLEAKAKTS